MSEPKDQTSNPEPPPDPVHCRRVDRSLPPGEHLQCPYCFGKLAEVEAGEHRRFCDFQPDQDPLHFGFPGDDSRSQQG
ncbi:MAG: hypothetical protein DWQ01_00375 [Planctomycetota bacterium]|nr:MAG: hypothetical protein DWQ01_00375 [Planctomycetota bacterium]